MENSQAAASAVSPLDLGVSPAAEAADRKRFIARLRRLLILGAMVLAMAAGGGYFAYQELTYVSTDNATVQAHTLMLSFRVWGVVTKVNVEENEKVKQGDILVELDDRDYRNAKAQADAQVNSLQARLDHAERTFQRMQALVERGSVAKQQFDQAQSDRDSLRAQLTAAQAQAELARLNLEYTKLRAPEDGTVAKKSVEPGMLAPVGQPVLGFVQSNERWVVANFKETDLSAVRVGRRAEVSVDAIPDREYEGVVESLSPSTGATFTLLPPDNATGNFTKVVQRVPVRIQLMKLRPEDVNRLQAGLSAVVRVKVR